MKPRDWNSWTLYCLMTEAPPGWNWCSNIPLYGKCFSQGSLCQTDRQTDRDAKGMKLIRHGQDIGVPTHHVNALGIWVFSEVWGLGFCKNYWGLLSLSTDGRLRPMLLILLDLVAGTGSKEGRIQKPPHRFIWSVQNRGRLSTSEDPSRKR